MILSISTATVTNSSVKEFSENDTVPLIFGTGLSATYGDHGSDYRVIDVTSKVSLTPPLFYSHLLPSATSLVPFVSMFLWLLISQQ